MIKTSIFTHRGLDPSITGFPFESSIEAFENQLLRGYGLEFDVQLTKDEQIVICHDSSLKRMTGGHIDGAIKDFNLVEIERFDFNGCHLVGLEALLSTIKRVNNGQLCALHLKGSSQTPVLINKLVEGISNYMDYLFIFDVTLEAAQVIKKKLPQVRLAPSVAHHYDIQRYNKAVGGTLWNIEEMIKYSTLFDWVWLDEWDRTDDGGQNKKLYSVEVFEKIRSLGLKVALVTPELHASSPGLLGGEAHPDAKNQEHLFKRIQEILSLQPDAVCTDYPDKVKEMPALMKG
jgi:glycerophosphoryl diester phosphodiesterase